VNFLLRISVRTASCRKENQDRSIRVMQKKCGALQESEIHRSGPPTAGHLPSFSSGRYPDSQARHLTMTAKQRLPMSYMTQWLCAVSDSLTVAGAVPELQQ